MDRGFERCNSYIDNQYKAFTDKQVFVVLQTHERFLISKCIST